MYMQYQASKSDGKKNILTYPLSILYILSTATLALDVATLIAYSKASRISVVSTNLLAYTSIEAAPHYRISGCYQL